MEKIRKIIDKRNQYLKEHKKAKVATAEKELKSKINNFRIQKWVSIKTDDRTISLEINEKQRQEEAKFDGCYVIKTDLKKAFAGAKTIHDRYKSLAVVENAFRTMKTGFLEMRPIFVRKGERTRAHVFIIMLAYMIEHQLRKDWSDVNITVQEGIAELASICSIKVTAGGVSYQTIPSPRAIGKTLLKKAGTTLPSAIPLTNAVVYTRKNLVSERKN